MIQALKKLFRKKIIESTQQVNKISSNVPVSRSFMSDENCQIVETATGRVIKPFGVTITKT